MTELFSQYTSGTQFSAGTIAGSALGDSGLNPIVDRLNSITSDEGAYSNLAGGYGITVDNGSVITNSAEAMVLTAGEAIDITNGSTISCELATTSNKGVASFNSTDFDVAAGAVTIDDNNTVRTIVAGEGIDVSSASGDVTVTGENATTSNKGIASFNSTDFAVSSGAVSLKNKTSYASLNAVDLPGAIQLPHGAVVTAAIVYGTGAGDWWLYRLTLDGNSPTTMATSTAGVEDTSISVATIDNSTYSYIMESEFSEDGARVTYTTDYD